VDWIAWNRARYRAYAPLYDWFVGRFGFMERGRRRALELAAIRPGERVLIVAAGTGLDLPWLPPQAEVTAIDIAPAMLARFTARASALRRQVRAEVMDAARLDFPDASFDCVLLHLAIAVVPDPLATIREVARVLRPGGRVSVFDKFLPDGAEASAARRAAGALARLIATDLNRQLGPLLDAGGLVLREREPAGLGGLFIAALAEKPHFASLTVRSARGDRG
jgi:ubiquinone/menaquinone biosynthesis C-methylase UbiE